MVRHQPWCLPARPAIRAPTASSMWLQNRVIAPEPPIRAQIERQGIVFAPITDHGGALSAAQEAIGRCDELSRIVHDVVGMLHLLEAPPGYDISHSEPQWLNRIFVSVPERSDGVGSLRLAEGVIHEAMHLELTLAEEAEPLVADHRRRMASPWRHEFRPVQGIVHGLFVFACLTSFFRLVGSTFNGAAAAHVSGRLDQIRAEVACIDLNDLLVAMTPAGRMLASQWFATVVRAGRSA